MSAPGAMPRRRFLRLTGLALAGSACAGGERDAPKSGGDAAVRDGEEANRASRRVALARESSPERNARAVLDAWGGIESLVGPEDLVLLKVNAQWYAQGMTNTDVLAEVIRAVLDRPGGFRGEIVVADNHHYSEQLSRGWITDRPNGKLNYRDLVRSFREAGHSNVGAVQWRDAGRNPDPWQGDAGGGTLVEQAGGGEGYRWWLEECYVTPAGQRCAMTWPVFRAPRSGELVDLRDGLFRDGRPTGRPLVMINLSSLNFHSRYAGVTASVKNLMGVVDMTCGFQGPEPAGYFNTHYIGVKPSHATWRWARRRGGLLASALRRLLAEEDAIDFHYTGGALAHWMRTVRRPKLHVVTAEWVGFGSRTREEFSTRPGMVLASDDPVTLDAVAAREVLLPATREAGATGRPFLRFNDPDRREGPFHRFLEQARREIGGTLDAGQVELRKPV